jgi:hypothetical protein
MNILTETYALINQQAKPKRSEYSALMLSIAAFIVALRQIKNTHVDHRFVPEAANRAIRNACTNRHNRFAKPYHVDNLTYSE